MSKTLLTICLVMLLFPVVKAQQLYDIKFPGKEKTEKCEECDKLLKSMPKEVLHGVQLDENDNLILYFTDKKWFDKLFDSGKDGVAIEIVTKDLFTCDMKASTGFRGEVQPPVYLKEMKKNMTLTSGGAVMVNLGPLPEKYKKAQEVEYNVLFLKNKYLCYVNVYYNIEVYRWNLLDMGFFFDTLAYNIDFKKDIKSKDNVILHQKTMVFEIPFEHDKSVYSEEDIRPLYDSLNITAYNIQKVTIRAYSSVEGSEDRNIILQQERAQSIVNALQSFQKPVIANEIFTSENWVDFLNDISSTKYASLADLSKDQIKEKLKGNLVAELEPILKNHRKAVVVMELIKKDTFKETPDNELVKMFNKSVGDKDLKKSIELQNSIFYKVATHESPISLIDKLEIPEQAEFSILLNNNAMFRYTMNEDDIASTYKELTALHQLMPRDTHIAYNLVAIRFRVWLSRIEAVDPVLFKKEIQGLARLGIAQNLIRRMLINYEIIMGEIYMAERDYVNKDKSLKYISSNYATVPMTEYDCLSLAQYFASYAKYDWAIRLLDKRVKSITVNEDLLFYYINLTILDDKMTRKSAYRTILLNAATLNSSRFCKLFTSPTNGGISFQILEDSFIRKTWCETCKIGI